MPSHGRPANRAAARGRDRTGCEIVTATSRSDWGRRHRSKRLTRRRGSGLVCARAPSVTPGRCDDGRSRELFATLIPLALVVALSPLSIIPALLLLVLHAARPKPTGRGFLFGWVVGLAAVTVVFLQVPHLLSGGSDRDAPTWTSWLRIGIGVALILFGFRRWATCKRDAASPPKWLTTVSRITPMSAATIGVVLVLINPKILLVTAAAGLSIGTAELGSTAATVAVAFYTTVAASTVAVPTLAYVVAAERVDPQLDRGRKWIERHQAGITAAILILIGLALSYTGVRAL